MKKLKNSETYVNLARAFAAECQARAKYEFIEYGARMNDYKKALIYEYVTGKREVM